MKKLALHIIAKDEIDELKRIIRDYGCYFDEIVIAYDDDLIGNLDVYAHDNVKLIKYEWCDDFSHKRNFVVENTESDYYFRMDTDDSIKGAENIRKLFEKAVKNDIDVVQLEYLYSFDEDGNCTSKHWRESLIKTHSDNHYWKKSVHENIACKDEDEHRMVRDNSVVLVHNVGPDHVDKSADRNFRLLMAEYKRDGENTDLRTISYIGRMLMGAGEYKKALHFLQLLVSKSGWEDDVYYGWIHIAKCCMFMGQIKSAIGACNEAMTVNPEFPDAYLTLMEIHIDVKEPERAIHWGAIGLSKGEPKTSFVVDPFEYQVRAPMNMAMALLLKGDVETACKYYEVCLKRAPSNDFIKNQKKLFDDAIEAHRYVQHLSWMYFYIKSVQPDLLPNLIEAIPNKMKRDERVQGLMKKVLPPKKWGDKSIVFFCGNAWEPWAPPCTINGIGGSEEAVIYLSKEFVKLGYDVTVFNNCDEMEGEYEGVKYRNFYEFNPRDEFDTLISWRHNIFNGRFNAKNKLIWLHDVPTDDQFKGECFFDKVIVLSEYHKSLLPDNVPEDKILVSRNGINVEDFKEDLSIERNPKRMIYTSSYDRGIEHLLKMWGDVKKEVPDAELHLFYGWETYDAMAKEGMRDPRFKQIMLELIKQDGVFEHGRVGHKQLVKEFQKSGIYVYPSHFEEISCISAMKAQACGCYPVVVDYAALKETVKCGDKIDGKAGDGDTNERFKNALIRALSFNREHKIEPEPFSWKGVAEQWSKEIESQ